MKVKFSDEIRLLLGVGLKNNNGVRMLLFDYTGKTILSIKDYEDMIQKEIRRVKALKGECAPWVVSQKEEGKVYRLDTTKALKHIGDKNEKQLADIGIKTVGDFFKVTTLYWLQSKD